MRPRGWIQDSGSLENLIKVVGVFNRATDIYTDIVQNEIPQKIISDDVKEELLSELQNSNGYLNNPLIKFNALTGSRTQNNIVDGIIQVLIPGQNRLGIVDWACDNYIRLAYTFDFISYSEKNDSFTITDFGLLLSDKETDDEKFKVIETALKRYPPAVRILELLHKRYLYFPENPSLTKFELGKELGFKGEDGFTTYSQDIVVQAIALSNSNKEKNIIHSNWEGSSDKYARMICGWLKHKKIKWVESDSKIVTAQFGSDSYSESLLSYKITMEGINAFRNTRPYSRYNGTPKNVSYEMLATKGTDKEYLRTRRANILLCIRNRKSLTRIQKYLSEKNLKDIPIETILDDINNFKRIGLNVSESRSGFKIIDTLQLLEIPQNISPSILIPKEMTSLKQTLSQKIQCLDHAFFDLLDLSIAGQKSSRQFEIRIVELLNLIITAYHLSGGSKPEIVGYYPDNNPVDCFIMDSKSYAKGFSIPANERDKMIRYINEYNSKNAGLNPNKWWERFKHPDYPINQLIFCFVSGSFVNKFANQLEYIKNITGISGCAITIEKLIEKVNMVLENSNTYTLREFFSDLGCNSLVR
jgi:hypothetical protein